MIGCELSKFESDRYENASSQFEICAASLFDTSDYPKWIESSIH